MESDRAKARNRTLIAALVAAVLLLLVLVATVGSCQDAGDGARDEVIAPPDDPAGPDGAEGVAAPSLAE